MTTPSLEKAELSKKGLRIEWVIKDSSGKELYKRESFCNRRDGETDAEIIARANADEKVFFDATMESEIISTDVKADISIF